GAREAERRGAGPRKSGPQRAGPRGAGPRRGWPRECRPRGARPGGAWPRECRSRGSRPREVGARGVRPRRAGCSAGRSGRPRVPAPTGTTVDDTILAVFTSSNGTCSGALVPVVCDDDGCTAEDLQSVVTATLTAGTKYFIVVWKWNADPPTAGNTAVQLRVSV